MKVHYSIDNLPKFRNAVVATGLFDGVHNGHKALIAALRQIAMEIDGESVLISFDPHPAVIFNPDDCNAIKYLNTTEEKIKLLSETKVNHLVLLDFTREFSSISAEDYIRDYVCGKINAKKVLSGYNHHFGKSAEGDSLLLENLSEKLNFDVVKVSPELIENELVSNSVILKSLDEGNIMRVNAFLGYSYCISGEIVSKVIVENEYQEYVLKVIDCRKKMPKYGRYASKVTCDKVIVNCLIEVLPHESGDMIKIYLRKDDLCSFANEVNLYFYKDLRLLQTDDNGYFFRTRNIDQSVLDELLF